MQTEEQKNGGGLGTRLQDLCNCFGKDSVVMIGIFASLWVKLVLNFSVAFFQLLKPYVSKGFIGIFVECKKPMLLWIVAINVVNLLSQIFLKQAVVPGA